VPGLQRPEHLCWFLRQHRGWIVSPALLQQMNRQFVGAIDEFARRQRKEDVARKRLAKFRGDEGVLFIGVAQENVSALRPIQKGPRRHRRTLPGGRAPSFGFCRGVAFVNQYYFYLLDRDFGLCFIKFSSFAPFGVRVWLNGHEWAKRRLRARRIRFEALDNGFLFCDDPQTLQKVCDSLSADHIDAFFRRWLSRLPHPFTREERRAGHRYQLSILQLEVSLTQVFDRPLHGREFFEEVIRDNLDLGRPDRVQLLRAPHQSAHSGSFPHPCPPYTLYPIPFISLIPYPGPPHRFRPARRRARRLAAGTRDHTAEGPSSRRRQAAISSISFILRPRTRSTLPKFPAIHHCADLAGAERGAQAEVAQTTSKLDIMPMSSCSSLWQCRR